VAVPANPLAGGRLLLDGAMGSQLIARGLPAGSCTETWNLERPDVVRDVSLGYFQAGSDAVQTNTFGANAVALARHRARGVRGAVFADRDGTLVIERGYLSDPADLELLPGVPEAIHELRLAGFAVVVISNQSGVGRGFFPLARVHEAMARLRHVLRARGAEVDAIYFCPHRPEAGCDCRKPGIGLLVRAADDLQLSLADSVFVGDKLLDVQTGHNAGCLAVLVRSGYGSDEARQIESAPEMAPPDRICEGFAEAAAWILDGAGRGRTP